MEKESKVDKVNGAIFIADVKCNAHWRNNYGQYASGEALYIGKIKIASYHYDSMRPRNESRVYKVTTSLTTIKSDLGNFETIEECKTVCLKVAHIFCKQLQESILP